MKNPDTRVQFTKAKIHEALVKLLKEKQIDYVTVKELCEIAGINRGTFYLHYASPGDVLKEIEEEAVRELCILEEDCPDIPLEEQMLERLTIMGQDCDKYAALIGQHGNPFFLTDVRQRFVLQKEDPTLTEEERIERQLCYDFSFSGTTGTIRAWLNGAIPCTAAQLAKVLARLHNCVIQSDNTNGSENK